MLARVAVALRPLSSPRGREERNIRRLLMHTGLFGVVNGGAITFLPVLLARLGASALVVSLLTALPALLTILMALPAGVIVRRWRRPAIYSGRCFYIMRLCYLPIIAFFALAPAQAPLLIVIVWGLSAIPSTLGNAIFYDILAEAISPRRRPVINGIRWAALGLTTAVSVAIFGQLLDVLPWPTNYVVVFVVSFLVGMTTTTIYSRLEVPPRDLPAVLNRMPLRKQVAEALHPLRADGRFGLLLAVTSVLRLGLFLPSGLYSIFWVRHLQATDAWIGYRSTIENVALTAGYYFWGRVTSRRGYAPVVVAAALGTSICPVLTGLVTRDNRDLLLGVAMLGGFFASGFDVSLFEWLLSVMPAGERPRYVAINTAIANLIAFAGPIIGAAVADRAGIPPVLFAAGGFVLLSGVLASRVVGRQVRPVRERSVT